LLDSDLFLEVSDFVFLIALLFGCLRVVSQKLGQYAILDVEGGDTRLNAAYQFLAPQSVILVTVSGFGFLHC